MSQWTRSELASVLDEYRALVRLTGMVGVQIGLPTREQARRRELSSKDLPAVLANVRLNLRGKGEGKQALLFITTDGVVNYWPKAWLAERGQGHLAALKLDAEREAKLVRAARMAVAAGRCMSAFLRVEKDDRVWLLDEVDRSGNPRENGNQKREDLQEQNRAMLRPDSQPADGENRKGRGPLQLPSKDKESVEAPGRDDREQEPVL